MDSLDQRNAHLDKRIEKTDLPKAVDTLFKAAKKQKRFTRLLAITVIFDVLLTAAFGFITWRTHQIAQQSESNRSALMRSCNITNEGRANNKKLWDYILKLPPSQERTPDQEKRLDEFRAFVDKTFAQRDCSSIK